MSWLKASLATAVAQAVSRALVETELETDEAAPKALRLRLVATDVTARTRKIAAQFLDEPAVSIDQLDLD